MSARFMEIVLTMLQPGRVSRGWSILSNRSFSHCTISDWYSGSTSHPRCHASVMAQTVKRPWWHVEHCLSARHFLPSSLRKVKPRVIAWRDKATSVADWTDGG